MKIKVNNILIEKIGKLYTITRFEKMNFKSTFYGFTEEELQSLWEAISKTHVKETKSELRIGRVKK